MDIKILQTKNFLNKNIEEFSLEDLKKLQNLINFHSKLYYEKQSPIISDKEYDELFKKLQILEEKFKIKNKQSLKVGSSFKESSFKKVAHSRPMISLDNTYNEEDLKDFDERVKKNLENKVNNIEYTMEFKFDGLGIELIYENGSLIQAITRGNGIEGEDVTENIRQIENIPKKINYKKRLEVRGEVVMPISVFKELNKKALKNNQKVFSNPRNAASGSIRTKDISLTKERKLKFFAYDLANFSDFLLNIKKNISTYFETIKYLENLGFEISSYFKIANNIEKVIENIDNFGDTKNDIDFEIDGLVIKVNNINLWEKIGWTQHHPKYAIAYKFPAEILTTKILSVDHQVGRTGTLTPVANLEAINIGGAIIKRATLHNYEEIEKLDIAIGDYVFIKRAGEVIPKIIAKAEETENRKKIEVPKNCPSCVSIIKKDLDKVRYFCDNKKCEAQEIEKLIYSVGKNGFNINGLGEKQVKKFYKLGYISDLVSIFELEKYREEILKLEGYQEKSVKNLFNSIEKSKKIGIDTFINSLNITGVGKKTAKTISQLFSKKEDLINFSYSLEDLEKLEDIGPEIGKNIFNFFNDKENKNLVEKLINILEINFFSDKKINKKTEFFGKKVCITGSFFDNNKQKISRDNLVKILEENGGKFVSSVSKNTDYLLAGEKAGSKLEKAKKLGVKVIKLSEFYELINKNG